MNRRTLLSFAALGGVATLAGALRLSAAPRATRADVDAMRQRWREFIAADSNVVSARPAIEKAPADWRTSLPGDAFDVLFEEDTERPFTSALNDEKRPGVFLCRACDLPLFTSEMKYDSGTGWPSFFTSIPDHLATKADYKLIWPRTEYHCVKCGGHQGHVFDDGPAPTGQRWCNNGVALRFVALT